MTGSPEAQLRATVADALERLNRERGGRYLGRVAAAIGVNRSSVSRWQRAEVAPTYERCLDLARHYPDYFDAAQLAALHTRVALGDRGTVPGSESEGRRPRNATTFVEVYEGAVKSLLQEPTDPAHREILLVSMHLEFGPVDPFEADPLVTEADRDVVARLREVTARRAREGWKIRLAATAGGPGRLANVLGMTELLEGPDVEVRAYPIDVPAVISPFVVGHRDVFLAFDGLRSHRPESSILLSSPEAVAWAARYFDTFFGEAPYRLRTPKGIDRTEMERFEQTVRAAHPAAFAD